MKAKQLDLFNTEEERIKLLAWIIMESYAAAHGKHIPLPEHLTKYFINEGKGLQVPIINNKMYYATHLKFVDDS